MAIGGGHIYERGREGIEVPVDRQLRGGNRQKEEKRKERKRGAEGKTLPENTGKTTYRLLFVTARPCKLKIFVDSLLVSVRILLFFLFIVGAIRANNCSLGIACLLRVLAASVPGANVLR